MAAEVSGGVCVCGTNKPFERCCRPFLDGTARPPTALSLMRSRYTAFVLGNADYLLRTWHPDTRPERLTIDPSQRWLGLKIRDTSAGTGTDQTGEVEFVARYKIAGRGHRLHERSRFRQLAEGWVYVDGDLLSKRS